MCSCLGEVYCCFLFFFFFFLLNLQILLSFELFSLIVCLVHPSKSLLTDLARQRDTATDRRQWNLTSGRMFGVRRITHSSYHALAGQHWLQQLVLCLCWCGAQRPNTAVTTLQINAICIAAHHTINDVVLWCLW